NAGLSAQVEDIRAKAAANGHSVKVGVNSFIIARASSSVSRAMMKAFTPTLTEWPSAAALSRLCMFFLHLIS
ncbi:hypothetical protein ACLBPX_33070, partial [Klebsiella pneumoniae]